ncbi:MAG: AAA family ATPase [Alphaproteobacteria bacterium]|nr:AAA family ATPase [Alphaproteobacteria bacterium]NCQ67142.1 AAA family ATPase [Alphaproteobacteria bacterium]NCT07738.1 AAA family ATPase [Alphaproteobacteria bacterium]
MTDTPVLEMNESFKQALRLMDGSSQNIFITGKAGTGKSTLLQYFRDHTQKSIVVLAPTGVAAVNVKGQTIHSFFRFKPDVTVGSIKKQKAQPDGKKNIYQKLDTLIIDEISMVRADLMDCMDRFLRLNGRDPSKPFGGLQLIFFGDLYQLAPVVSTQAREIFQTRYSSPYFFSANVFNEIDLTLVELDQIYRQKDTTFIEILNAVRNNTVTQGQLDILNRRYVPDLQPSNEGLSVFLTPTNKAAQAINDEQLKRLEGKYHFFDGITSGSFDNGHLPAPKELQLKIGSQVMMLNNDAKQRWINGTMARVLRIFQDTDDYETIVQVELENGRKANVTPYKWELYNYKLKNESIVSEIAGGFRQYPLTLAWGITVHKSQGKTFDKAVIDLGDNVFSSGQTYVALSRCTSLEGLSLRQPVLKKHIRTDPRVVEFLTAHQYKVANKTLPVNHKMHILGQAADQKKTLSIIYLQSNGIKTARRIEPQEVKEMTYQGQPYQGVKAYCQLAEKQIIFQVHQILEIKEAP